MYNPMFNFESFSSTFRYNETYIILYIISYTTKLMNKTFNSFDREGRKRKIMMLVLMSIA